MPIDPRQYDSAIDYIDVDSEFSKAIGNMANMDDKLRLKAYELYEDMYNNRPEHMRVVMRGEDEDGVEIYLPSAKKCIEAINRFLCTNYQFKLDKDTGTTEDQQLVAKSLCALFKQQNMHHKFHQLKRYMLIKGDACLHVVAKEWERDGHKITIEELKPEHYFPIEDLVTGEMLGCHIVDIIRNPKTTPNTKKYSPEFLARRQTYRRVVDINGTPTGPITSELTLWASGRWDDRVPFLELQWVDTITSEFQLPDEIACLPVYHFSNNPPPCSSFGMSELTGVESLITAINQAMSDEDLTLITQGLGVYWTDASPPVDSNGEIAEWEIGPGSVVEIGAGGKFGRVSGVNSVTPYLEHILAMDESIQQALGVPDIAIGMVDVATAESGIALSFKLGPLLAKNAEKELMMKLKMDEFLEDLVTAWLPAYENFSVGEVLVQSKFDDPTPTNASQLLQDLLGIWGSAESILSVQWFFQKLNEIMGYDLSMDDFHDALMNQIEEAKVQAQIQQMMPQQPTAGGGSGGNGVSPAKTAPKAGSSVSQIDNLTKYTQSERLSRQTGSGAQAYGGSLSGALASGGI